MLRIGRGLALATTIALGGCAAVEGVQGPPTAMEQFKRDPIAAANIQTRYIEGLRIRADLPQVPPVLPAPASDWAQILQAGIDQIDEECNNYLDQLYKFNAQQRAARQGLTAATATTGVILGLTGAAATTFGITAAALGLAASLFDAGTNSVLFSIEPSAVRNVVKTGQQRYIKVLAADLPTNRPRTINALRGYLQWCTPSVIEANVNSAANGTIEVVTSPNEKDALKGAGKVAPSVNLSREERAARVVDSRINPDPPKPPPLPPNDARLPGEPALLPTEIRQIEKALGRPETGIRGLESSPFRRDIREFEAALQYRRQPNWVVNPIITERTAKILASITTPMPADLKTPFERGFMTNVSATTVEPFTEIDADRLFILRDKLKLTTTDGWPEIRKALATVRKDFPDLPQKDTQGRDIETLDAALWEKLRVR